MQRRSSLFRRLLARDPADASSPPSRTLQAIQSNRQIRRPPLRRLPISPRNRRATAPDRRLGSWHRSRLRSGPTVEIWHRRKAFEEACRPVESLAFQIEAFAISSCLQSCSESRIKPFRGNSADQITMAPLYDWSICPGHRNPTSSIQIPKSKFQIHVVK